MFKKILFTWLVICAASFAQRKMNGEFNFSLPFFSEVHVVPHDSLNDVYFLYRIPFNTLVFVKDNDVYSAQYSMAIEVDDSSSGHAASEILQKKVVAENFAQTDSKSLYDEGFIRLKLKRGKYVIDPILTDLVSKHEHKLFEKKLDIENGGKDDFLNPVVVHSERSNKSVKEKTNNNVEFVVANFSNDIPFDEEEYDLIIPCKNKNIDSLRVTLLSNKDTVLSRTVVTHFNSDISYDNREGKIILAGNRSSSGMKYFILDNFSAKLNEGRLVMLISDANKSIRDSSKINFGNKNKFIKEVVWINKPFSLRDPELAIKDLAIVEDKNVVDSLLSGDSDKYQTELFKYWKKFDPTPSTAYNPVMNEFYERVDYAGVNYLTLSKKSGVETDRGKIYIKYGKPAEIERTYNQYGRGIEIWKYSKLAKTFTFVDQDGTGNFSLVKSDE